MASARFVRERSGARTRLAVATAMLTLPVVVIMLALVRAPPMTMLLTLVGAFVGACGVTEVHAWLLDKGFLTWQGRLRVVANVEMDVPPWKSLPEPVRKEYMQRVVAASVFLTLMGIALLVKSPSPSIAWFIAAMELQFLFVTRPTTEAPPPPEEPEPVTVTVKNVMKVPA